MKLNPPKESVKDRFLRYVKIDTQSVEDAESYPSTEKQFDLLRPLVDELKALGVADAAIDKYGYVTATVPSNLPPEESRGVATIGFIAHVDTSPAISGKDVKPVVHENYQGGDIVLPGDAEQVIRVSDYPNLESRYKGMDIVTSDGTTLLGADDKSGVAEIMTAVDVLMQNPGIKHGPIKIGFTPDEEVGNGTKYFDVKKFGADFAYTVDGGEIGEMEYETFNATRAYVTAHGISVHPGDAKDVMINAIRVLFEFDRLLPEQMRPEHTEGREGFFHLWKIYAGNVDEIQGVYALRDHNAEKLEAKKRMIQDAAEFLNKKYGSGTLDIRFEEQYRNMREVIEPMYHIVETAQNAMRELGIEPITHPIRGGTDGAKLSFRGLPTPNLFNGGHNYHGPYEYLPVESLQKASDVIVRIIEKYAE